MTVNSVTTNNSPVQSNLSALLSGLTNNAGASDQASFMSILLGTTTSESGLASKESAVLSKQAFAASPTAADISSNYIAPTAAPYVAPSPQAKPSPPTEQQAPAQSPHDNNASARPANNETAATPAATQAPTAVTASTSPAAASGNTALPSAAAPQASTGTATGNSKSGTKSQSADNTDTTSTPAANLAQAPTDTSLAANAALAAGQNVPLATAAPIVAIKTSGDASSGGSTPTAAAPSASSGDNTNANLPLTASPIQAAAPNPAKSAPAIPVPPQNSAAANNLPASLAAASASNPAGSSRQANQNDAPSIGVTAQSAQQIASNPANQAAGATESQSATTPLSGQNLSPDIAAQSAALAPLVGPNGRVQIAVTGAKVTNNGNNPQSNGNNTQSAANPNIAPQGGNNTDPSANNAASFPATGTPSYLSPAADNTSSLSSAGGQPTDPNGSAQTYVPASITDGPQQTVALGLLGDPTLSQQIPVPAPGVGGANAGAAVPPGLDQQTFAPDAVTGGSAAPTGDVASAAFTAATQGVVQTEEPSAASTASPLPQAANAAPAEQIKVQLTKGLKDGSDTINVTLHPEDLGTVEVKLQMQDGQVKATITANNADTLALLQADQHHLQQSLQAAGFTTDSNSLSFQLRGDQQANNSFAQQGQNNGQNSGGNLSGAPVYSSDPEQETAPATILGVNQSKNGGLDINV